MANDALKIFVSGNAVVTYTDDLKTFAELSDYYDADITDGKVLGLTNDAGESIEKIVSTTNINAHQLLAARVIANDGSFTLSFSALETNDNALELYYGVENATTTATRIELGKGVYKTFYYDTIDTDAGYERHIRYSFQGLATPNGAVDNSRAGAALYPILVTSQGDVKRTEIATPAS